MTVLFVCLAIITAIPFFHRAWVNHLPRSQAEIKNQQTWLALLNFACLFVGALSYNIRFNTPVQALFFASMISFAFLYRTPGQKAARPTKSLRASSVQLGFLMIVMGICLWQPVAILIIPFFLPWVMPRLIQIQFECLPLEHSELRTSILSTFAEQKISVKEIMILNHPNEEYKNAFTCGNVLFISLSLFQSLDLDELHAVIFHEGAHLKLGHFSKRIWASIGYLMTAAFCIVVPFVVLFPGSLGAVIVSSAIAIGVQLHWLGRTIHDQEHEADLTAIECGASADALISALKKLSPPQPEQLSLMTRLISGNHHPTLNARVSLIETRQKFPIQRPINWVDQNLRKGFR